MAGLPVGYRFKPSKTQLIGYFLTTKLNGQQLPSHYPFLEIDVYSNHPFKILASKENEDGFMEGYFFTPLKKTTSKGKRASRVIEGQGTWSGKSKVTDVYDETMTKVIGFERYYKFEPVEGRKSAPENEFEWKMHEYALIGDNNEIVLCHITNKLGNGGGCRSSSKRVRNYDIMDSNFKAKRSKIENGSLECNSSIINPTQPNPQEVVEYDYASSQDRQQYVMSHAFDQQYTMPYGIHQQYTTRPCDVINQNQRYVINHGVDQNTRPHGDGFHQDHQHDNTPYGLEETINSVPHMVEGETGCSDEQGITSLNPSSPKDSTQVPQEDDRVHDDEETCDQELVDELEASLILDDEQEEEDNGSDDSNKALAEELVYNNEHLQQEDDQIYDNQEQAFAMTTNGAQDNETRFECPTTRCDYNTNELGFEHGEDPVDFTWLHELVAA